jgi:hypothetical protein
MARRRSWTDQLPAPSVIGGCPDTVPDRTEEPTWAAGKGEPCERFLWQVQPRLSCSAWLACCRFRTIAGCCTQHSQIEDPHLRRGVQPVLARCHDNVRPPDSPVALGDEITFHDQLSQKASTSATSWAPA